MCVQIDVGYNDINQAASLELIAAMKGKCWDTAERAQLTVVSAASAVMNVPTGTIMHDAIVLLTTHTTLGAHTTPKTTHVTTS